VRKGRKGRGEKILKNIGIEKGSGREDNMKSVKGEGKGRGGFQGSGVSWLKETAAVTQGSGSRKESFKKSQEKKSKLQQEGGKKKSKG